VEDKEDKEDCGKETSKQRTMKNSGLEEKFAVVEEMFLSYFMCFC
jgi:hypothetical protein